LLFRARKYVRLSNKHDLESIEPMFLPDATYVSAAVGRHEGRDAIMSMMRGFFIEHPDVVWEVEEFRTIDSGVEFDFVMRMGGTENPGVERLIFDNHGIIRHVEVAPPPPPGPA